MAFWMLGGCVRGACGSGYYPEIQAILNRDLPVHQIIQ